MNTERLKKLREERAQLWERMKGVMDTAREEDRDLTGEEAEEYDRLERDIDERLSPAIQREERHVERQKTLTSTERDPEMLPGANKAEDRAQDDAELREFRAYLRGERRAAQVESDTEGGYLLAPQTVAAGLLKEVDDRTFVRNFATKHQITTSESLGVVSLDADMDDAEWTGEITQTTPTEPVRFGKRELKPRYLTKETKLSRPLVRRTAGGAEQLVMSRLSYKFATTQEKAFLLGDGQDKPLGVFVPSVQGIPTSRDVSTDMTATELTGDGLIEVKHALKPQYWPNARWGFHRDGVKQLRKLKTGDGQYLWAPGLTGGQPNTILDLPYDVSEFIPNTFTASQYVGILADWSYYWILDCLQLEVQVLNELYARTNQFGYIGRLECDGMPVLAEAFVRIKLGS